MAPYNREIDIAKNARTIEWLKSELLNGVASLFKALLKGKEDAITDSLANIVIASYVLARRLGINFARLETKVENKLDLNIQEDHEVEKWYGDLTALRHHFQERHRP